MENVAYELREGGRSQEEALAFAQLAVSAGGDMFPLFFGPRATDLMARLYPHESNFMSHRFCRFAWVDGEIAGLMCGFSYDEKRAVTAGNSRDFVRYGAATLPRMIWYAMRLNGLVRALEHLEQGEFYVEFLAVYPRFQRMGISQALLNLAEQQARSKGCRCVVLDVDIDNISAIRAYEKWGMHVARSSKTYAWTHRTLGVHRMERTLSL